MSEKHKHSVNTGIQTAGTDMENEEEQDPEFRDAPIPGSRKMPKGMRTTRYVIAAAVFVALAIPTVAFFLNNQHILDDDVGTVLRIVEAIVGFIVLILAWVVIRFLWDLVFAAVYGIAKAFYGSSFGFGYVDALTFEHNKMHDRRVRIRMAGVAAWLTVNVVMLVEILRELFSR